MRPTILGVVAAFALFASPHTNADSATKVQLKPFNVTIRVFDLAKGHASGQDYVLPVDSPDAEHAASSTMANAVSFTKKIEEPRCPWPSPASRSSRADSGLAGSA